MPKFYSPTGNFEVWAEKPAGYYTADEWAALHPAPATPGPTKEQRLAALDAEYEASKAELLKYFTDALLNGDTEQQAAIKEDMAALTAQYDADYAEIEGGE
jgi:hypothetical protein